MSEPTNSHAVAVPIVIASLFLIVHLATLSWDTYAAYFLDGRHTVSQYIQGWAERWPIFPLLVGIILGHLFWTRAH